MGCTYSIWSTSERNEYNKVARDLQAVSWGKDLYSIPCVIAERLIADMSVRVWFC